MAQNLKALIAQNAMCLSCSVPTGVDLAPELRREPETRTADEPTEERAAVASLPNNEPNTGSEQA